MRNVMFLLLVGVWACGCATMGPAWVPHDSPEFAERPHIVKRGTEYYFRYRMAQLDLVRVFEWEDRGDRACFWMSNFVSLVDVCEPREYALADLGFEKHAEKGELYWLNPGGREVKLVIVDETDLPTGDGDGTHTTWP